MALDRRGDDRRQAPAADEHRADEGVVDAELAALAASALLGRLAGALGALLVAVELGQHQLADVVEQRGDGELVALRQARQLADPLGADPHRDAVAAEALVARRGGPGCSSTS